MTEQDQLAKIITLVESNNQRLDSLDHQIKENQEKLREEVKRWDDRFFQLVKEQGQTSRTIIIAAASVVVLSPVLGTVAEFVARLLAN
jgi:septal ring factor EnvC (AmiA/AmiB activator)